MKGLIAETETDGFHPFVHTRVRRIPGAKHPCQRHSIDYHRFNLAWVTDSAA